MNPLAAQLKLKQGLQVALVGAPNEVRNVLSGNNLTFSKRATAKSGAILPFPRRSSDVADLGKHLTAHCRDALLGVAFPEKSSSIQADVTLQDGWEPLTTRGLHPAAMASTDRGWPAVRFGLVDVAISEHDRPQNPELSKCVDRARHVVQIPPDLKRALAARAAARHCSTDSPVLTDVNMWSGFSKHKTQTRVHDE